MRWAVPNFKPILFHHLWANHKGKILAVDDVLELEENEEKRSNLKQILPLQSQSGEIPDKRAHLCLLVEELGRIPTSQAGPLALGQFCCRVAKCPGYDRHVRGKPFEAKLVSVLSRPPTNCQKKRPLI